MTESDNSKRREDKAVQALISAALHVSDADVTAEEIGPYLCGDVVLSGEDAAALKRKGSQPFPSDPPSGSLTQAAAVENEEFMALHRKQPGQGFSPKTEEEIKRKREELLAELRKRKKGGG
ncbi:MAG: hypothetical protein O2960_28600 [Verrucomicrobia bacterium]|nr:hypothetical protein [Verrucomicrobiota bacterium]